MKKLQLPLFSLLLMLFVFNCENEPIEGFDLNDDNATNSLIGTWTLVSFDASVNTSTDTGAMVIDSEVDIVGSNPDYDLTFTSDAFTTTGSYGYSVTSTVNGQTTSQDLSVQNVNGVGTYTDYGDEIVVDGSFFTLEFQGIDLSEFQGEQTVPYTISEDGQTLTFSQNITEISDQGGVTSTSTNVSTSVWSKISNSNTSCADAIAFTASAEEAYNNDTSNQNLCNAYKSALQNQIVACGDADGALQSIIDGLGDCATQNLFVSQIIVDELNGTSYTETYSYNGNQLTSVIDSDGFETTYEYENDILTRINNYESGVLIDYLITEYDTDNQLVSYTVYITQGNEGLRFDLTYNTDGTVTEKEYSGDHNTQDTLLTEVIITMNNNQIIEKNYEDGTQDIYQYDNQNGIYKNISNLQTLNLINIDFSGYIDGGQNNLVSVTYVENGNSVVDEEFIYTYNANNYPDTSDDYFENILDTTRQYIY